MNKRTWCSKGHFLSALTRIIHKISWEVGQDVALGSFTNTREHYHVDKVRGFEDENGVADCPNFPRVYEISGLVDPALVMFAVLCADTS